MPELKQVTALMKRRPALYRVWRGVRALANRLGWDRPRTSAAALRRHARAALSADLSHAGETAHLLGVLETCGIHGGFVVDIAAGDGVTQSCTLALFRHDAWRGLAVELDPRKALRLEHAYRQFPGVRTARARVTPLNIEPILRCHDVPERFEVLNLDLDSYDLWVMEALLRSFRPAVITMEINEKVPPPVYFAVLWSPDHVWREDHFYGCSLEAAASLVRPHGYVLESLRYNNAFFVRADIAHGRVEDLGVEEAYATGYRDRADRVELFPWNHDMEHLHALEPDEVVRDLTRRFAEYAGRFRIGVGAPADGSQQTGTLMEPGNTGAAGIVR
jgi:hypothetical protein